MAIGITQSRGLSQGELSQVPLVEILGYLYAQKKTGRLALTRGRQNKEIFFFDGVPIFATSSAPAENLFEVMAKFHKLTQEEALQLRALQKEKGLSPEDTLKSLGSLSDPEIYCFQMETFSQMVINACGWSDGHYQFQPDERLLDQVPMFDLSPLDLIYRGVKNYHALNLAQEIQQVQEKKVRIAHGWEQALALPRAFYQHSDILDLFDQETSVGESIPRLHHELGDLNEALLLLYMLLVTGLLAFSDQETPAAEPKVKPEPLPAKEPPAPVSTIYISTQRVRERIKAPTRTVASAEEIKKKAAEAQNVQRQTTEAEKRLEAMENHLSEAAGPFQVLAVEVGASPRDIQKACTLLRNRIRLDQMPLEVQQKLKERAAKLETKLDEVVQTVSHPEKRVAYEQEQFQEEKKKAWNIPLKKKLALQQWKQGQWYLDNVHPEFAPRYFEQAVELDPEQPLYYAYVGWATYRGRSRNLAEARAYLSQALNLNPLLDQAHYFLGLIAKREGDPDLAEHHFRKALESNPQHAQAKRELGLLASHQKQESLLGRLLGKTSSKK